MTEGRPTEGNLGFLPCRSPKDLGAAKILAFARMTEGREAHGGKPWFPSVSFTTRSWRSQDPGLRQDDGRKGGARSETLISFRVVHRKVLAQPRSWPSPGMTSVRGV